MATLRRSTLLLRVLSSLLITNILLPQRLLAQEVRKAVPVEPSTSPILRAIPLEEDEPEEFSIKIPKAIPLTEQEATKILEDLKEEIAQSESIGIAEQNELKVEFDFSNLKEKEDEDEDELGYLALGLITAAGSVASLLFAKLLGNKIRANNLQKELSFGPSESVEARITQLLQVTQSNEEGLLGMLRKHGIEISFRGKKALIQFKKRLSPKGLKQLALDAKLFQLESTRFEEEILNIEKSIQRETLLSRRAQREAIINRYDQLREDARHINKEKLSPDEVIALERRNIEHTIRTEKAAREDFSILQRDLENSHNTAMRYLDDQASRMRVPYNSPTEIIESLKPVDEIHSQIFKEKSKKTAFTALLETLKASQKLRHSAGISEKIQDLESKILSSELKLKALLEDLLKAKQLAKRSITHFFSSRNQELIKRIEEHRLSQEKAQRELLDTIAKNNSDLRLKQEEKQRRLGHLTELQASLAAEEKVLNEFYSQNPESLIHKPLANASNEYQNAAEALEQAKVELEAKTKQRQAHLLTVVSDMKQEELLKTTNKQEERVLKSKRLQVALYEFLHKIDPNNTFQLLSGNIDNPSNDDLKQTVKNFYHLLKQQNKDTHRVTLVTRMSPYITQATFSANNAEFDDYDSSSNRLIDLLVRHVTPVLNAQATWEISLEKSQQAQENSLKVSQELSSESRQLSVHDTSNVERSIQNTRSAAAIYSSACRALLGR